MKKDRDFFFKVSAISLAVLAFILIIVIMGMVIEPKKVENNVNKDVVEKVETPKIESEKLNSKMEENNSNNPIVVFETNLGNFEVELFEDKSPITAGNFKSLVEQGFYDGIKFHRVIKDFMIQGGDPLSKNDSLKNRWGSGGAEPIEDEFIKGLSNTRGTLSMANAGPNTGSSQFFINLVDNTYLDWDKSPAQSKHPVFGKIVSGMDIIDKIGTVKVGARDVPAEPVIIRKAYLK